MKQTTKQLIGKWTIRIIGAVGITSGMVDALAGQARNDYARALYGFAIVGISVFIIAVHE